MAEQEIARIESRIDVETYIQKLRYALNNGAEIRFQGRRLVDERRSERYTNTYTVRTLFPNDDPIAALKRELLTLSVENYMRTVKDLIFPLKSEMREFGKVYNLSDDVYIKIRVDVFGEYGRATTFVMSFHFAERAFQDDMFPYRTDKG